MCTSQNSGSDFHLTIFLAKQDHSHSPAGRNRTSCIMYEAQKQTTVTTTSEDLFVQKSLEIPRWQPHIIEPNAGSFRAGARCDYIGHVPRKPALSWNRIKLLKFFLYFPTGFLIVWDSPTGKLTLRRTLNLNEHNLIILHSQYGGKRIPFREKLVVIINWLKVWK